MLHHPLPTLSFFLSVLLWCAHAGDGLGGPPAGVGDGGAAEQTQAEGRASGGSHEGLTLLSIS